MLEQTNYRPKGKRLMRVKKDGETVLEIATPPDLRQLLDFTTNDCKKISDHLKGNRKHIKGYVLENLGILVDG